MGKMCVSSSEVAALISPVLSRISARLISTRHAWVLGDAFNNIRCKVKPVEHLLLQQRDTSARQRNDGSTRTSSGLEGRVAIAEICCAGLPYYADTAIDGTGMTAANGLTLRPDLHSFRILPYSPKSAVVMGNSVDRYDKLRTNPAPFVAEVCWAGWSKRQKNNTTFHSQV